MGGEAALCGKCAISCKKQAEGRAILLLSQTEEYSMEQELRRVYYDPELGVEACLFQGIDQGFPEHFHTY